MGLIDAGTVRAAERATVAPRVSNPTKPTMPAMVQRRYGQPHVLELAEVAVPEIGDDQVLVQVRAASIGAWVDHLVAGDPYAMRVQSGLSRPRRRIRASDIAGRVVAVGPNVERFRSGDEVYGEADEAFALFAAVAQDSLARKPKGLTFEQAAAVPIAGQTALLGLRDHGHLQQGEHVLIIGATGGVGSFAVQIAKSRGATVTAVCHTSAVSVARELGADHVFDYTDHGLMRASGRFDVVFQLGGSQRVGDLRDLLTPKGTLVLSSGEGGRWFGPLGRLVGAMMISPFVGQRLRTFVASTNVANLAQLTTLVERGDVVPVIDRTYALDDMAEALCRFRQPHGCGKVVIAMPDDDPTV